MANTVEDDIARYLQDQSLGTVATDIFKSKLPASPASALAVIDTGGVKPDGYIPTYSPTFQVYLRNTSHTSGRSKMRSVRDALHSIKNTTIGNTYYYYILALSEPGYLGLDDDGRDLWSANFICLTR